MSRLVTALVTALTLLGCDPVPEMTDDPMQLAAFYAVEQAWADVGAPELRDDCNLDRFVVLHATADEYWGICGDPAKSYGCYTEMRVGPPLRLESIPRITVAPWWHIEPTILVHELLHGFERCSTIGRDPKHLAPVVWEAVGGANTAQAHALTLLREQGWLE